MSEQYLAVVRKTPLELPSIGLERKTYFPLCLRFFDPGVCSRFGWTVSTRDVELVVQFEQRLNCFERLIASVRLQGKSIASRLFGVCVLHEKVGTITHLGLCWPSLLLELLRGIAYPSDLPGVCRWSGNSWMLTP